MSLAAVELRRGERTLRAARHAQLDALARADLLQIARHRFGTLSLPDDAEGERFLRALLLKGLPAIQVLDVAPWARRRGVDHYLDRADRRTPDADRLGELIEFSFDDLKAMKRSGYGVRYVAPFDAQPWQVREFWRTKRLKAERLRKRRKRKGETSTMSKLTVRARRVHEVLLTRWTSVPAIMKAVTLRGQRNRRLAPDALRLAVRRALDELVACGLAETKTDVGEHGVATRFARRFHLSAPVEKPTKHWSFSHVTTQKPPFLLASHMCGQILSIWTMSTWTKKRPHMWRPAWLWGFSHRQRRYFGLSAHLLT